VAGKKSTADHEDDPGTVGLGRLNDIKRERGAELAPVDDVFGAFEVSRE